MRIDVKLVVSIFFSFLSLLVMCFLYLFDIYIYPYFIMFFVVFFIYNMPRHIISPLSFFYLYYGVFYVVAPLFAERYNGVLHNKEYSLSFLMLYATFSLGVCSLQLGEFFSKFREGVSNLKEYKVSKFFIGFLIFISTLMCILIVINSGGFSYWMRSPGDAFLNRAGTGHFVILSHFFSIYLSVIVGYYTYTRNKYFMYVVFLFWLIVTSPVHGSKMQISLLLLLSIIPWVRNKEFISIRTLAIYLLLMSIFFLGLYFRNVSWMTLDTMIPYALNYFTALDNLAISVRDFNADFLMTFWLPFNKFLTPFGRSDISLYYDMNHYLTSIYFPKAWEIRATEQWPVETDLYLNFYFIFGLPLLFSYLFVIGYLYGMALKLDSLGYWAASFLMIIFMMSHLRGSLYNHVDFYMYPYILFVWFSLRKFRFSRKE